MTNKCNPFLKWLPQAADDARAYLRAGRWDDHLADDAVALAMAAAWRRWLIRPGRFTEFKHLQAFLKLVARHRAIDLLRAQQRRPRGCPAEILDRLPERGGERSASDEDLELLHKGIAKLSPQEQIVIVGHWLDGRSDKSIGIQLFPGQPESAAGQRFRRKVRLPAEQKLRVLVKHEGKG